MIQIRKNYKAEGVINQREMLKSALGALNNKIKIEI